MELITTTYIGEDIAHGEVFRDKVSKGYEKGRSILGIKTLTHNIELSEILFIFRCYKY